MNLSHIEDDWRAEEDGRTLMRAGEIQNDPERLARAQNFLKKQSKAVGTALGKKPTGNTPSQRRRNKATLGTVPVPR